MQVIELILIMIILIFATLILIAMFVSLSIDIIDQIKSKLIQKRKWKINKRFNAKD